MVNDGGACAGAGPVPRGSRPFVPFPKPQRGGLFRLFSNKERFRIGCLLARGEFCVKEITEVVSEGKLSGISQHLKYLTLSGVVERRRENQRILYSLKDERVRKMIEFLQKQFLNE